MRGNPFSNSGTWIDLQPLGTEGQFSQLDSSDINFGIKPYSKIQLSIPFGIGVRMRINHTMDLWFEIGIRFLFTDYIDDVSKNYVDLGVLPNDLSRTMSYRTNELSDVTPTYHYLARDGNSYTVVPGYGHEHFSNIRGNSKDNDFLFITTIRVTHIINASMHKAKSR